MFKTLLKSRFAALGASLTQRSKKRNSNGTKVLLIILFAFLGVYFVAAFGMMFFGFSAVLYPRGDGWQVFALASLIASALCMFGSIFTTKTQIFESGDNELLLSMPIPPRYIFFSRMAILLLVNYGLEALVMLPAMIAYAIAGRYSAIGVLFGILAFMLIPMLTLALSSLIGWVISIIASKMRNKTIVTTILFVAFFAFYFYFVMNMSAFFGNMEDEASIDFSGLKDTYIFYWIGDAIANANVLSFLFFALSAIIPSAITFYILNRSFVKIVTTKRSAAKIKYKERKEKQNSVYVALTKKEINRFFTSSAYIMNAGSGNIMIIILAVVAAINRNSILSLVSELSIDFAKYVPIVIAMYGILMSSMDFITAPSISLENKNLWILQSSPIRPYTVFMAKITSHIIICTPLTVISVVILCVAFGVPFAQSLLCVLATLSMIAFGGYFGMLMGLKFPKFDWQNENVAVKQGFAVFGAMFGGMLWSIILIVASVFLSMISPYLAFAAIIVVNSVICLLFNAYFKNGAEKEFRLLKQ
ncbi:MAG: hypothetical protein ACI3XS_02850 [Eubacteriales bacterium]